MAFQSLPGRLDDLAPELEDWQHWIVSQGGELKPATNQYEVLRVRMQFPNGSKPETAVLYRKVTDRLSWYGRAIDLWHLWREALGEEVIVKPKPIQVSKTSKVPNPGALQKQKKTKCIFLKGTVLMGRL
jgi:hypothetical protein